MQIDVDEVAKIIGFKEIELYGLRKQLAQTRKLLMEVTTAKDAPQVAPTPGASELVSEEGAAVAS